MHTSPPYLNPFLLPDLAPDGGMAPDAHDGDEAVDQVGNEALPHSLCILARSVTGYKVCDDTCNTA